jgi:hypothetical protein
VISTSPLSGLAARAGEPALGARFWRVNLALFLGRLAKVAVAADARLRQRLFDFTRRGESLTVGDDRSSGARDDVRFTTYNYIGFRLAQPRLSLSQSAIGFVFSIYLVGAVSSAVMGELAGRCGRRRVIGVGLVLMPIGVLMTLPDSLALTIFGVGVLTAGGGHSIASSWVGLRAETAAFVGSLSTLALLIAMKLAGIPPPAHLRAG